VDVYVDGMDERIKNRRTTVYVDVYGDVYVYGTDEQTKQTRTLPFVDTTAERGIKHPKRRERKRPLGH